MDRSTTRRLVNEFTTTTDLSSPGGIERYAQLDKYIEKALKSFIDEGKLMRNSAVHGSARHTSYSFANNDQNILAALKAVLREAGPSMGYQAGQEPFQIGEIARRRQTTVHERYLDPREQANVREQVRRLGGSSTFDKTSGTTSYTLPRGMSTADLQRRATESDAAYMRGESRGMPGLSSSANPYERAYAKIAQHDVHAQATSQAEKDYIKNNPNSQMAKEANSRASVESASRAKTIAGAIVQTIFGTIVKLLVTSVAVLYKINQGMTETAANTLQLVADSARFNIDHDRMSILGNTSTNMGLGRDAFSKIFGQLTTKFANIDTISSPLMEVAPWMQGGVSGLIDFSHGHKKVDDTFFDILAGAANATQEGRKGVEPGHTVDEALSGNMVKLEAALGAEAGTMLSFIMAIKNNNGVIETGESVRRQLENKYGDVIKPAAGQIDAAKDNQTAADKALGVVKNLVNDVWMRILASSENIWAEIKNLTRAILSLPGLNLINPGFVAADEIEASAQNQAKSARIQGELNSMKLEGTHSDPVSFARQLVEAVNNGDNKETARLTGISDYSKRHEYLIRNKDYLERVRELDVIAEKEKGHWYSPDFTSATQTWDANRLVYKDWMNNLGPSNNSTVQTTAALGVNTQNLAAYANGIIELAMRGKLPRTKTPTELQDYVGPNFQNMLGIFSANIDKPAGVTQGKMTQAGVKPDDLRKLVDGLQTLQSRGLNDEYIKSLILSLQGIVDVYGKPNLGNPYSVQPQLDANDRPSGQLDKIKRTSFLNLPLLKSFSGSDNLTGDSMSHALTLDITTNKKSTGLGIAVSAAGEIRIRSGSSTVGDNNDIVMALAGSNNPTKSAKAG